MLIPVLTGTLVLGLLCLGVILSGAVDLVLLLRGAREARRWRKPEALTTATIAVLKSPLVPPVAVIATPPDATRESRLRIRRLLELHAGSAEVVAVLDGASGSDLAEWVREFHLAPCPRPSTGFFSTERVRSVYASRERVSLLVVDKETGGEPDGLNAALNYVDAPVIALVDPHARLADEALLLALQPMIADPDHIIGVCAAAPIERGARLLARLCRLHFWRTWLSRCALASWGAVLPVPGAITILNRDAVIRAGGFAAGSMEMIVRLQRRARAECSGEQIRFLPIAAARPKAPRSSREAGTLYTQDRLECRGALGRHAGLLLRQGSLGWLAIPELLRGAFLTPLLEIAALTAAVIVVAQGSVAPTIAGLLLASTFIFRTLVSMTGVILAEYAGESSTDAADLLGLFLGTLPENTGYRQWRNLGALANLFRGARR